LSSDGRHLAVVFRLVLVILAVIGGLIGGIVGSGFGVCATRAACAVAVPVSVSVSGAVISRGTDVWFAFLDALLATVVDAVFVLVVTGRNAIVRVGSPAWGITHGLIGVVASACAVVVSACAVVASACAVVASARAVVARAVLAAVVDSVAILVVTGRDALVRFGSGAGRIAHGLIAVTVGAVVTGPAVISAIAGVALVVDGIVTDVAGRLIDGWLRWIVDLVDRRRDRLCNADFIGWGDGRRLMIVW
jgi:hypothetical protein